MRTRLLGSLGVLLTLVTLAAVVSPDLADALAGLVSVLEASDGKRVLLVVGSLVGLYAAWTARRGPSEQLPTDGPAARFSGRDDPPEAVTATDATLTGESFDGRVGTACAGDDEALGDVRETLADAVTSARVRTQDCSPGEARRAVETAAWTDDPLAGAFLAGEGGPGFPLVARLRSWLDPEAERRRRIDRTVAALRWELAEETQDGIETGRNDSVRVQGGGGDR